MAVQKCDSNNMQIARAFLAATEIWDLLQDCERNPGKRPLIRPAKWALSNIFFLIWVKEKKNVIHMLSILV